VLLFFFFFQNTFAGVPESSYFDSVTEGGGGGTDYTDTSLAANYRLSAVIITQISSGSYLGSIQACYSQLLIDQAGVPQYDPNFSQVCENSHGCGSGCSGATTTWTFQANEYWISAEAHSGSLVDRFSITTNLQTQSFGDTGGGHVDSDYNFFSQADVVGFYGGSGDGVDRLGLVFRQTPCQNGGVFVTPYQCSCPSNSTGSYCQDLVATTGTTSTGTTKGTTSTGTTSTGTTSTGTTSTGTTSTGTTGTIGTTGTTSTGTTKSTGTTGTIGTTGTTLLSSTGTTSTGTTGPIAGTTVANESNCHHILLLTVSILILCIYLF